MDEKVKSSGIGIGIDENKKSDKDSTGDTGMIKGKIATHKLKKLIVKDILQPAYIKDIKDVLIGRYRWRKISMSLFVIAVILKEVAMVVTFLTAVQSQNKTAFIAGSIAVFGTIFLHSSSLAKSESKRATQQANTILKQLGVDGIPDIETDKDSETKNGDKTDCAKYEADQLEKINKELETYNAVKETRININNISE